MNGSILGALCAALAAAPLLWVDGSATGPADGGSAAPFRTLQEALAAGPARIQIRTGLYRGPFRLDAGTTLAGRGQVVLYAGAGEAVVHATGPVELEAVTLQGGTVGLELEAGGRLERVQLDGAREVELRLLGGRLTARDARFDASFPDAVGLRAEGGAWLDCERCAFQGPFRRGAEVEADAGARWSGGSFQGAVTGVRVSGGRAELLGVHVSGGRGPGLLVEGGEARFQDVVVAGQGQGVVGSAGARVEAVRLSVARATGVGVELRDARARLRELEVLGSGEGAVRVSGGEVLLESFWLDGGPELGLDARGGGLTLRQGAVTRTQGVRLDGTRASLDGLAVSRATKACLTAVNGARVRIRDASLEHCAGAGLLAERLATVRAGSLDVRGVTGPALVIPGQAGVAVDVLEIQDTEGAIWAECTAGALAAVWRSRGAPLPESPCVSRGP